MKRMLPIISAVLFLAASGAGSAFAEGLVLKPESTLWIEGDSTLHPYSSTATRVDVASILEAIPEAGPAVLEKIAWEGGLRSFELSIPVDSMRSHSSGLDRNLRRALKVEDYPLISFRLADLEALPALPGRSERFLKAAGELTVAGETRPVELEMASSIDSGRIRVRGAHSLLMSDYGVRPPSLMLGTIKVKDPVTVRFDLFLSLEGTGTDAAQLTKEGL